jgi:hypothetical protein
MQPSAAPCCWEVRQRGCAQIAEKRRILEKLYFITQQADRFRMDTLHVKPITHELENIQWGALVPPD